MSYVEHVVAHLCIALIISHAACLPSLHVSGRFTENSVYKQELLFEEIMFLSM